MCIRDRAIGGVKLKRLTAIQIQKMYNDSKTSGRVQRFEKKSDTALSGSTVRRIHMVLSSALKQAVKERIIPYNPCDNCRIPPKEKKGMAIIPPEKLGVYLRDVYKRQVQLSPTVFENVNELRNLINIRTAKLHEYVTGQTLELENIAKSFYSYKNRKCPWEMIKANLMLQVEDIVKR